MPFSASISCRALRMTASRAVSCAPFSPERLEAVLLQAQPAGFVDFKLGQLEAARPKIHRQK